MIREKIYKNKGKNFKNKLKIVIYKNKKIKKEKIFLNLRRYSDNIVMNTKNKLFF